MATSRAFFVGISFAFAALSLTGCTPDSSSKPKPVDPGSTWNDAARNDFYTLDQGSRIMPLAWMQALEQVNGKPFLEDSLARYGYIPNPLSPDKVPVGFTVADSKDGPSIGMNCAACHTRELDIQGKTYRIDGGPAIVDFEALLIDLNAAVASVLASDQAFGAFAKRTLGGEPDPNKIVALRAQVQDWHLKFDTLVSRAMPKSYGGPGRLDAIAMIFNRLAGLDIGTTADRIIASNIEPADAPVRYPFLWNAAIQDRTQWTGFAANGNDILGLARNLGEVYGVFAHFEPVKELDVVVNFMHNNSANFVGLNRLEQLVRKLEVPKWPLAIDTALAEKGEDIYNRATGAGGCVECHNTQPGKVRFLDNQTWKTPVLDVATDSRTYQVLSRKVNTGMLEGVSIPLLTKPLGETDSALNVLTVSVLGSILENLPAALADGNTSVSPGLKAIPKTEAELELVKKELLAAFAEGHEKQAGPTDNNTDQLSAPAGTGPYAFESRAMMGIWAAAPYLHNGSVPTLEDLLKPSEERTKVFTIGPNYDMDAVGIAKSQTKFNTQLVTTGCDQRDSGNSNCGHEFGTSLPADEKKALLEYLKTL